jgi:hypothetical protein
MTFVDSIITPPPNITDSQGYSDAVLICSIFFKNKKYAVEGRKYGMDSIYWDVEELGFVMTSNNKATVFSLNELNTPEITQTFTMWHKAGMGLLH